MELDVLPSSSKCSLSLESLEEETCEQSNDDCQVTILDGKFFKATNENCTNDRQLGTCMLCMPSNICIKGYRNSSTNFISHLRKKHGNEAVDAYKKYAKEKRFKRNAVQEKLSKCKKQRSRLNHFPVDDFNKLFIKFINDSMVPLSIVENKYLKEIFTLLGVHEQGINICSRRTLAKEIDQYYYASKQNLVKICEELSHICTTCDIWSKRGLLGVTIHWISKRYERKSAALACRRVRRSHTAQQIVQLLHEIYSDFAILNGKVVATVVTENSSNFVKSFRMYGVRTENINNYEGNIGSAGGHFHDMDPSGYGTSDSEQDGDDEEDSNTITNDLARFLPCHVKSCSHTLYLCATKDAMKAVKGSKDLSIVHNSVLQKCNALWKLTGSPKTAGIIQNVLGHTLSPPKETRWNSLYDSLQQILNVIDKNMQLHKALNLENPLHKQDFLYISEHLQCTKPLAELIDILLEEKNNFYGISLPSIIALDRKLQTLCQSEWVYCTPLVTGLKRSVRERFSDFFLFRSTRAHIAAIAAFSYPRFKKSWLQGIDTSFHEHLLNIFRNVVCLENPINAELPSVVSNEDTHYFDFGDTQSSFPTRNLSTTELEIFKYFVDPSRNVEQLESYPSIKKIFYKYNTPIPSNAPVERLFHYTTMTHLQKSNKLSYEFFEKRVILKGNMTLLDNLSV